MTIWSFWCTEVALPKSETTVSCLSAVCTPKTSIKFRNEWSLIVESEWGCSEMLAIFSSEALICYRSDLTLFISLPKPNSFETKICFAGSSLLSTPSCRSAAILHTKQTLASEIKFTEADFPVKQSQYSLPE